MFFIEHFKKLHHYDNQRRSARESLYMRRLFEALIFTQKIEYLCWQQILTAAFLEMTGSLHSSSEKCLPNTQLGIIIIRWCSFSKNWCSLKNSAISAGNWSDFTSTFPETAQDRARKQNALLAILFHKIQKARVQWQNKVNILLIPSGMKFFLDMHGRPEFGLQKPI